MIVEAHSHCSVKFFRLHWIAERSKIEKLTKSILGKDKQAIASMPDKEDFRSILDSAGTMFRDLVDSELWTPASQKDKGEAPAAFITQAELNTAVQK